jgi:NAD(P)H-hydrate epimerase
MHTSLGYPAIMTREEVRAFDAWAIEQLGLPGMVLMENAGRACSDLIRRQLSGACTPRICIFCGTGNNGGDGFVCARHLFNQGLTPTIVLTGDPDKVKGDARANLDVLIRMGRHIEVLDLSSVDLEARVKGLAGGSAMVVDAIFGTGLKGEVSAPHARLIRAINGLGVQILAVDIPSGLDCDTGKPLGEAIRAAYTMTFVAMKKGFTSPEAKAHTGEVIVASIGVVL